MQFKQWLLAEHSTGQLYILRDLIRKPLPADGVNFDGRFIRALLNKGLAEITDTDDGQYLKATEAGFDFASENGWKVRPLKAHSWVYNTELPSDDTNFIIDE